MGMHNNCFFSAHALIASASPVNHRIPIVIPVGTRSDHWFIIEFRSRSDRNLIVIQSESKSDWIATGLWSDHG